LNTAGLKSSVSSLQGFLPFFFFNSLACSDLAPGAGAMQFSEAAATSVPGKGQEQQGSQAGSQAGQQLPQSSGAGLYPSRGGCSSDPGMF